MIPNTIFDHFKRLQEQLKRVVSETTNASPHLHTIRLFRAAVYLWALLYSVHLLPITGELYGASAYIAPVSTENMNMLNRGLNLLWSPSLSNLAPLFIGLQILLLILGIIGVWPRTISSLIFFVTFNLYNKSYVTLDGGNNLMILLMFYLIWMGAPRAGQRNSLVSYLDHTAANYGLLLARLQVCAVYACAALGKVTGELWPKGVALYYTLNVNEYTHPWAQSFIAQSPLLVTIGSLGTLLFQLSFPFLIWNRRLRGPLMLAGSLLHLSIALVMGLVFFGFAMMISYLVFQSDERSARLLGWFRRPPRLVGGFDSQCPLCMKVARFIQTLDWIHLIVVDDARRPTNRTLASLSYDDRTTQMAAVCTQTGQVTRGYWVFVAISRRVFAFLPFYPVLLLIGYMGWGDFIYRQLATQRMWRKNCAAGVCTTPERSDRK